MVKLFISQPMKGKTEAEIMAVRQRAIQSARRNLGVEVEIIESYVPAFAESTNPLRCLSESLKMLSTADVAYFAPGWENARGCRIENECAVAYGITVIEDYTPNEKFTPEITITERQYHDTVMTVLTEELDNPATGSGMGKILIPMVGAIFAKKIEAKLFHKEDNYNG